MGLDGIELILAIEARFQIEIPDADVPELTTPRKLIDYLATRLNAGSTAPTPCLTRVAFHKIRKEILELTGLPKLSVHPSTPLKTIFQKEQRRTLWPELQKKVNLKRWPRLVRPSWLSRLLFYSTSISFLISLMYFSFRFPGNISLLLTLVTSGVIAIALQFSTRSFATEFCPPNFTVGDLAHMMLAQSPMLDAVDHASEKNWSREEIATITRGVIMEQLGIASFSDDDHFVKDLGVD